MDPRSEDWSRVKELFALAGAQAPELREAFLNDACAGNDALRQEVESLLTSSEEDDGFLETPAAQVLDRSRAIGLLEGRRFGPYELSACIGAGGMGEVYKARDTRLNRTVAIKVLPAHLAADPPSRERFEREARAVASLDHRQSRTGGVSARTATRVRPGLTCAVTAANPLGDAEKARLRPLPDGARLSFLLVAAVSPGGTPASRF